MSGGFFTLFFRALSRERIRVVCCFGILVSVTGILYGCSDARDSRVPSREEAQAAWYNSSVLRPIFGDFDRVEPLGLPGNLQELVERGRYLAQGPSACGFCHGDPKVSKGPKEQSLSGGRLMKDGFGVVRAANITPDKKSGIGEWNYVELMRAIRSSIDKDGKPLSIELHEQYRWMPDRDVKALALYLLSSDPVFKEVERRELGGFERNNWIFFSQHRERQGYVPKLPEGEGQQRGMILAYNLAGCYSCHSPRSSDRDVEDAFLGREKHSPGFFETLETAYTSLKSMGKEEPYSLEDVEPLLSVQARKKYESELARLESVKQAKLEVEQAERDDADDVQFPHPGPNIKGSHPDGLLGWSVEEIMSYLNSGMTPRGDTVNESFCPWSYFKNMTEADKRSIALFIKSL